MSIWASRPLRSPAVVAAVSVPYFGSELAFGGLVPSLVDWLVIAAADVLAVLICVRVAWSGTLSPAATRYWRTASYGMTVITMSMVIRAIDAATGLPLETFAEVIHGLGAAVMLWGTFRP